MKLPEATQLLIEQYLCGQLSEQGRIDFEARLAREPKLKKEVERQEGILDQAFREGMDSFVSLQDRVKAIHEEVIEKKNDAPPKRWTIRRWLSAAAAIFVLASFAYFLLNKSQTPQELFAEYAQSPKISLVSKGQSAQQLLLGQEAFNERDFQAAVEHFSSYLVVDSNDFQVILYRGMAYLQLERFAEGEKDFQTVAQSSTVFRSEGNWYRALSYLKQNKLEACKKELNQLLDRQDFSHREEARIILREIGE